MSLRLIMREAWLNVTTGVARAGALGIALLVLLVVPAAFDTLAIRDIHERAREFRASGGSVHLVTLVGEIDGLRCDALAEIDGVTASGALRSEDDVRLAVTPSTRVPVFAVTPGFGAVLGVVPDRDGVLLPAQLAHTLGAAPGSPVVTDAGEGSVAGVYRYPSDGRIGRLGFAMLAPEPPVGRFDECWAELWPTSEESLAILRLALVGNGEEAQFSQLNTSRGATFDGARLFTARPSASAPLVTALLAFGLGAVAVRLRRLALASALHARVSRRDLSAICLAEMTLWASPVLLLGVASITLLSRGDFQGTGIWGVLALTTGAVGLALGALAALRNVREEHLFRYFADR